MSGVHPDRRCRWCGASYEAGTYRAHTGGQEHREWLAEQRRKRARWKGIAAYRQSLRDEKKSSEQKEINVSKVVIDLWEDNAGGLYLHPEGADIVYAGVEQAGSAFAADAAEMAASGGEYPPSWDVEACSPSVLARDEARIVASWEDGKISLQADAVRGGAPGRAAREYLGLSNDDEQTGSPDIPEWVPTHRHHWGPNPDQFDELMLCDEGRDDGSVGAYTREEWEASIRGHWPEMRRCADGSWVKAGSYGEDQDCTPRITTLTDERVDGLDLPLGWS